jgi:hypothetical protein
VAWGAWQLRELTHLSLAYGIIAVASLWYFRLLIAAVSSEVKLARLGARAHSIRTWTPFNLGFIYDAVCHMLRHRNHEFWWANFEKASKGGPSRWTIETITLGERVVLTADEENMKAILATQFGSYGKGPQFRKEWKDFLGLSRFAFVRYTVDVGTDFSAQASSQPMEICGTPAAN